MPGPTGTRRGPEDEPEKQNDGAITAIPGYNHAIEVGRIVRELGGPEPLAHMVEAHSFAGALIVPRTRDAQRYYAARIPRTRPGSSSPIKVINGMSALRSPCR